MAMQDNMKAMQKWLDKNKKKKTSEYGGKEVYASKKAKMKHEKGESKATERREKRMK